MTPGPPSRYLQRLVCTTATASPLFLCGSRCWRAAGTAWRVHRARSTPGIRGRLIGDVAERILVSPIGRFFGFNFARPLRRIRRRRRLDALSKSWPSQQQRQHDGSQNPHSRNPPSPRSLSYHCVRNATSGTTSQTLWQIFERTADKCSVQFELGPVSQVLARTGRRASRGIIVEGDLRLSADEMGRGARSVDSA
jgi:hypothetical protein